MATNLPKDFYHEFDVKAGDIVLFDGFVTSRIC